MQNDSSIEGTYSFPLLFETLPEISQEESQWTNSEIKEAINLVCTNLQALDSYLALMVMVLFSPFCHKTRHYFIN